ncbi:MAG TPA: glycosyltransferase [Bryobacteraceae bacterium]|nr:glycosyltransferase [Bryobacteraceae bacterium]
MNVTVALDARYALAPDGSVWSQAGMARGFWERYLAVFDTVQIVARAARVSHAPEGWLPVNGRNVVFHALPDYCGPWEYLKRYPAVWMGIRRATPAHGAVILRVASQISNILESQLLLKDRPYALEVIGDPYEVFSPGVVDHPLRPFFRWHFSYRLRRQCLRAIGVAYVTKRVLQERYPSHQMSMGVSDVDLPEEAILDGFVSTHYSSVELDPRNVIECVRNPKQRGPYQVVTVGSLAQLYKGTDVLIDAAARCVRAGLDLTLCIVGGGKHGAGLMALAERLGIGPRIRFLGQVTAGEPVRRILDAADLFVLPSRTEGLPRAMIEAMARGLPCIGSHVGGIPELLEPPEMVPPGDPSVLASRIVEVLTDCSRMRAMSQRNLMIAREYLDSVLEDRRRRFYQYVKDYTQRWEAIRTEGLPACSES